MRLPGMVMTNLNHITYKDGYRDYDNGGIWVEGETVFESFQGAIMGLSYQDLKYDAGGAYTIDDRKLYTYNRLITGEKIEHDGIIYTIARSKDYSQFGGGLFIYILRRGDNQ